MIEDIANSPINSKNIYTKIDKIQDIKDISINEIPIIINSLRESIISLKSQSGDYLSDTCSEISKYMKKYCSNEPDILQQWKENPSFILKKLQSLVDKHKLWHDNYEQKLKLQETIEQLQEQYVQSKFKKCYINMITETLQNELDDCRREQEEINEEITNFYWMVEMLESGMEFWGKEEKELLLESYAEGLNPEEEDDLKPHERKRILLFGRDICDDLEHDDNTGND